MHYLNGLEFQVTTPGGGTSAEWAASLEQTFFLPYNHAANVQWAYNQLKQLPEFAGAVDV